MQLREAGLLYVRIWGWIRIRSSADDCLWGSQGRTASGLG